MNEPKLFEDEGEESFIDPDSDIIKERKLFTQPYDLVIHSLIDQIRENTLHLRPISDRPKFQRHYLWSNKLASRLIESILMNVPIPPVYLSQNSEFELDVIDGQQRLYSIYRYINNEFPLTELEVMTEIEKRRFHELDRKLQLKLSTHTIRGVIITNDSHPEIKFDVFQRLNSNTVPLNAQELRNCIYRGPLNDLLGELSEYEPWLEILNRKKPDKRMRDEELILRFFAYHIKGLESYKTPQKHWLNDTAELGKKFDDKKIQDLRTLWKQTIDKCLIVFSHRECFRREPGKTRARTINRALMDTTMYTLSRLSEDQIRKERKNIRKKYYSLFKDGEFDDLISRAIDHKSRTLRRFEIWNQRIA